jgi:hypothetical protein
MRVMTFMLALLLGAAGAAAAGAAEPVPTPKMIFFSTGSTRGTIGGRVTEGSRNLYSVKGTTGQTMTVTITAPDDNAVFQVYEPGTQVARDADGLLQFSTKALAHPDDTTRWSERLPRTGTYLIVVGSTHGRARYSVDVRFE